MPAYYDDFRVYGMEGRALGSWRGGWIDPIDIDTSLCICRLDDSVL